MAKRSDGLLNDAIRGTENEIFAAALDDEEPDDSGDRDLEEMTDDEPEAKAEDAAGKDDKGEEAEDEGKVEGKVEDDEGEDDDEPEVEDKTGKEPADQGDKPSERRGDPANALRDERERRRAAEGERDKMRGDLDAMRRDLDEVRRKPAADEPKAPEEPDPIVDPKGYREHVANIVRQEAVNRRVEETFGDAHDDHGEKFEAAYGALKGLDPRNDADRATVQGIMRAPNPGKALMRWHGQREVVREIGTDPAAYRARIREEILADPEVRKQLLADTRREANGGGGRPANTITRLPSLNSSSGNSGRVNARRSGPVDDSDEAVFADATADE